MIYVLDGKGNLKRAGRREPTAPHWNIYFKAKQEVPHLYNAMRETIGVAVENLMFFDREKNRFPNSTWIGKEILSSWEHKTEWDKFCGNEEISSALFGEIMWTCMWDDSRDWCTTLTSNANEGREERVYFLVRKDKDGDF